MMGYSREQAMQALKQNNWVLQETVNFLSKTADEDDDGDDQVVSDSPRILIKDC